MTVLQPGRHVALGRRGTPARGTPTPVGHLVVDASHSALCPRLAKDPLTVTVDDLPLQLPWGRTDIALPAGRHRVEIAVDRGDGWGRVVDAVPVAAGHTVDVYYRAPALGHRPGSLGPVPQPTAGALALLGLLGAVLLLLGGLVAAALVLLT